MPIYEYICKSCGKVQEHLVRNDSRQPCCRKCNSESLSRKLSVFAVATSQSEPSVCACGRESGCCNPH